MLDQKNRTPRAFKELRNTQDLIAYLNAKARLSSSPYLYQYTSISALVGMVRTNTMHLGNAKHMNDQLEYSNGDSNIWRDLFFTCFMSEEKENIGMWSMYAQPWHEGVKLSFPKEVIRSLVADTKEVIEISQANKQPTGRRLNEDEPFSAWISAVAYSNRDGISLKKEEEVLRCGGETNSIIFNAPHIPSLTGYIKDMAWSYEKEIRVKVKFDNYRGFERIAIPLPDYVIDSMIVTPSPLFEGSLQDRLRHEISRQLKMNESKFTGKLSIRSSCESCSIKNNRGWR